ncbi:MAG TPA: ATP-binding cassette domain-containing protein [Streptosporangiaceae bacterium]|nr:ATP-binding cassette domain-containing protein [Streptosporangiaceae bacterium]
MTDELAIEATGLKKSFGDVRVLGGVDLTVPRGTVFALLGPNGAGKTTTVRILTTLTRADAGRALVAGRDVARERHLVRRSISLAGQYAAVDGLQTGTENLLMMGRLAGLSRARARRRAGELLEQFGLAEAARRRVATYSGGMRRRLDLAASLVGAPSVIFLDEPTTGLDLPSRQVMWQVVAGLADDGVTVFLTTQYLEEADLLADRIAVLDDGRVVADGTPGDLKELVSEQSLDLELADTVAFDRVAARAADRARRADRDGLAISLPTDGTAAQVRALLDELDPERTAVRNFSVHTATLDDVFLAVTRAGRAVTSQEQEPIHV